MCSHGEAESERSETILDVTCGHCWNRYDKRDDRLPNVREMEKYSALIRDDLETAGAFYNAENEIEMITEYAFWFLDGPDSLPENLRRDRDIPGREALLGQSRKRFMTSPLEALPSKVWSKRYREHVDRVLRAMRPVLVDPEKAQESRVDSQLEERVLNHGDGECPMCGKNLSASKTPTVDHIIPKILGGPAEEWNLRVLCNTCNSFKHVMVDPGGVETVADRLEEKISKGPH